MARLLDAKVILQSQGNLDPSLWHALILAIIFGFLVVGNLLDGVPRGFVEPLDIVEGSTSVTVKRVGSHGPNTIDARERFQDFVFFIFENGFCGVLVGCGLKSSYLERSLVSTMRPYLRYSQTYCRCQTLPPNNVAHITFRSNLAPIHRSFAASFADLIFLGYA